MLARDEVGGAVGKAQNDVGETNRKTQNDVKKSYCLEKLLVLDLRLYKFRVVLSLVENMCNDSSIILLEIEHYIVVEQ